MSEISDNDDDIDDLDDEFSLDQLSRAYAEVMREKNPQSAEKTAPPSPPEDAPVSGDVDEKEANTAISLTQKDLAENKADNANCPLTPESIVEAMLFVGTPKGVPFAISQIAAELRDVTQDEVRIHIADLNRKYEQENAAFRIVVDQQSVQMALVPELKELQNEFYGRNKQFQLSQSAIDVLSVVAYNQPTTREQVETARGKPSGSILAQLVRRSLLSLDLDEPKPANRTYTTTARFLELFRLSDIDDLPQSHDVSEFEEYIND